MTPATPSASPAVLGLLVVQLLFGVWPVIGTLVLQHLPPVVLTGARITLAGPVLWLIARPWRARMPWPDVLRCGVLALFGVVVNQLMFVEGLARSSAVNAAVLGCLIPVDVALIAILARQERARPLRLFGLGLALLGALVLVGADRLEWQRTSGNLLLVGNGLVYSVYLVLARPLVGRHGAVAVVGWVFAWAVPLVWPFSLGPMLATDWAAVPADTWLGLGYIVLGASVAGYLLNAWAMKRVTASTVAAFAYLQPLVTGVAADRILHTRPGVWVWLSAALILIGVTLVTRAGVRPIGPPGITGPARGT